MAPALSGVATAVFVVAVTGVTLVVHRRSNEDRAAERYRTYEDFTKFNRFAGGGDGTDNSLIVDVDEYTKNGVPIYSYQHWSRLEVDYEDEEEYSWRSPAFQNSSYVPTYNRSAAGEWFRVDDGEGSGTDHEKRDRVKQMMIHAWDNYKLYAWGKNELKPLTKRGHSGSIFGAFDLGATIVDGLDTLYLMGLHKEYDEGRDWVERKFTLENVANELSVFETNIRFIGGFLTCYAFTGDRLFLEKAKYVADKLLPAFQTPTGIPYALVNPTNGLTPQAAQKIQDPLTVADIESFTEARLMTLDVNDIIRSRGTISLEKKVVKLISRSRYAAVLTQNRSMVGLIEHHETEEIIQNLIFIDSCHPFLCCVPEGVSSNGEVIFLVRRKKLIHADSESSTSEPHDIIAEAQSAMHIAKKVRCIIWLVDINDSSVQQKHTLEYDEGYWSTKIEPKLASFEDLLYKHVILKKYSPRNT